MWKKIANKGFWRLVGGVYSVAQFAVGCVLLFFPIWFATFVVPDVTGFLKELGQELPPVTLWLIKYSYTCGVICTIVNIGYPAWHFFIKRQRTNVFTNNIFRWWVFTTNFVFLLWLIVVVFAPIPMCNLHKMN